MPAKKLTKSPAKKKPIAREAPGLPPDMKKVLEKFCGLLDDTTHSEYALAKLAIESTARITQGGFDDAKQFWEQWIRKARPEAPAYNTLTRWMRVARTWPEDVAGNLGFHKLDATLAWLNLKGLAAPRDPTTLSFQLAPDATPVKFADCSVQDIEAAIRALKSGDPEPLDAQTAQLKKNLEDALSSVMPHGAAHVHLIHHQGHAFFDFKSIPAEAIEDVCRAVLAKVATRASRAR